MIRYVLLAFLMTVTFQAFSQAPANWKMKVGCKQVAQGEYGTVGNALLPSHSTKKLYIRFSGDGNPTQYKRSVMIFDNNRAELLRKELPGTYGRVSFNIAELKEKTHGQPFQVFTVVMPTNPEEAAVVRIAPAQVCNVSWQGK